MYFANALKLLAICSANSRVGASTSALGALFSLTADSDNFWISGKANAAVLPVPVCALTSTSLPFLTAGIALR